MKQWLLCHLTLIAVAIVASRAGDGSSPEEICPCQPEDECQNERHIFGRDPLDIQKFGLISPCRKFGQFPCCPRDPPPPKEIKLTANDFQGFSPAELAQLGVFNEGTIGSSSLPIGQPFDQAKFMQRNQQPIDITQPGAASLAPAGAASPNFLNKKDALSVTSNQPRYAVPSAKYVWPVYQQPQSFNYPPKVMYPVNRYWLGPIPFYPSMYKTPYTLRTF